MSSIGDSLGEVAAEVGMSSNTVSKWRARFVSDRLEGLTDEPRPGRPRVITDDKVDEVIATTLEQTPRHRHNPLPRHVHALPVQPDQEALPGRLRHRQPDQLLTCPKPAITLFDRSHRCVQRLDHTQPVHQFIDPRHPGHRRQAGLQRTNAYRRSLTT